MCSTTFWLTNGQTGSAAQLDSEQRISDSDHNLRPRCFCFLLQWELNGQNNEGGCALNWRHLALWDCLSSLNNAKNWNKISFNYMELLKQSFGLYLPCVVLLSSKCNHEVTDMARKALTRSHNDTDTMRCAELLQFLNKTGHSPNRIFQDQAMRIIPPSPRHLHRQNAYIMCWVGMEAQLLLCLHSGRYSEAWTRLPNIVQEERHLLKSKFSRNKANACSAGLEPILNMSCLLLSL